MTKLTKRLPALIAVADRGSILRRYLADITTPIIEAPLNWECRPASGEAPFNVDLTPFTNPIKLGGAGRPRLIGLLSPDFRNLTSGMNKNGVSTAKSSLRLLWKFLDLTENAMGEDTDCLTYFDNSFGNGTKIIF